jgi:hypothetical protein
MREPLQPFMGVTEDGGSEHIFMNTQGFALCWDIAPLQGFTSFHSIKLFVAYKQQILKINLWTFDL